MGKTHHKIKRMSTVAEAYRAKVTAILSGLGADEARIQRVLTNLALREALVNHTSAEALALELFNLKEAPYESVFRMQSC